MHDGALNHTLKTERGLCIDVLGAGHGRGVLGNELDQVLAQVFYIRADRAHHLCRRRVVKQGEQQVLDRDELMAFLPSIDKRHVQADFQFLRNHD